MLALIALAVGTFLPGSARASEFAYLAFANSVESLAVANEYGSQPRILLTETSTFYWGGGSAIALSPSGRHVAFCANEDNGSGYHLYIYLMDITTGALLWKFQPNGSCASFDFRPDGRALLYSKSGAGLDIGELVLNENLQIVENRSVLSWGGYQGEAHYTSDGSRIIFSSNSDPEGQTFPQGVFHLLTANLQGGEASNLTQELGAKYSLEPDARLDGKGVVFSCGFTDPEVGLIWSICRVDINGTGGIDLNVDGWGPHWLPDGEAIVYNVENGAAREIKQMDPSGANPQTLPLDELPGPIAYGVSKISPRQTSNDAAGLARIFRPAVRLDEGERWKPLELTKMVAEIPPRICIKSKCQQIFQLTELAALSGKKPEKAVLDIPPVEGEWDTKPHVSDADNYGALDCSPLEGQAEDCEDLEHSAIYYDATHVSPGNYLYLEYWLFYRFNDSPLDQVPGGEFLDHEADWENVSVAIPSEVPATTFDFVTFAQHGSSYAYLREALTCEVGNECGGASKHVDVYVAGGTHASYGQSCSGIIPCFQSDGITPETDHGGEVNWLNNGDAAALRQLPETYGGPWLEGPKGFTDWPGMWGYDADFISHVASPANGANQDQFETPWLAECYGGGECQTEGQQELQSAPLSGGLDSASRESDLQGCDVWFGSGVSAVLCSKERLHDSLSQAAVGRREGSADLRYETPEGRTTSAATTGGLAQLAGPPLQLGDKLTITGSVGKNAVLLVRAEANAVLTEARFELPANAAAARVLVTRDAADLSSGALPVVVLGDGVRVEPSSVSAQKRE